MYFILHWDELVDELCCISDISKPFHHDGHEQRLSKWSPKWSLLAIRACWYRWIHYLYLIHARNKRKELRRDFRSLYRHECQERQGNPNMCRCCQCHRVNFSMLRKDQCPLVCKIACANSHEYPFFVYSHYRFALHM